MMFGDIFQSTSTELFQATDFDKKPKKTKKKSKKQDYKETMKNAPISPYACKNHNNTKLRIRETTKSPPTCKSCGFKCEGDKGYLSCPESSGCFSICSACKICSQNHMLRHCVSLKQFDNNALYAQNKFKCFSCQKEKQVGINGVYHCGPCSFSICGECLNAFDCIWEQEKENNELEVIKEEEAENME